jgi:hypothetical protein
MSSGPGTTTKKETVYSGPEVDPLKSRKSTAQAPASAKETVHEGEVPDFIKNRFQPPAETANSKETVHEGDVPEFITNRFGKPSQPKIDPARETIHHGPIPAMFLRLGQIASDIVMPDRETIYNGPEVRVRHAVDIKYLQSSGEPEQGAPRKETVYDENSFVAKRVDTTASRALVTRLVQKASVRFFSVAVLSILEMYFHWGNLAICISSGIMFGTFVAVGIYTFHMNLKALLFAIGIYTCSTLFMLAQGMMSDDGIFLMIPTLISRGFMIYNLLRTYGLLVDLHLLEAEAW